MRSLARPLLVSALLLGSLGPADAVGAVRAPGATQDAPQCRGQRATIVGTSERDVLVGTRGRDVMVGLGGADTFRGRGGPDLICGGTGKDRLRGGAGGDVLLGQEDGVFRAEGRYYLGDVLAGGKGSDELVGGDPQLIGDPDVLRHPGAQRSIRVNVREGTSVGQGADTFRGIREVSTSDFADVVTGVHGDDWAVITGRGDDTVTTDRAWGGEVTTGGGDDRVTSPVTGPRVGGIDVDLGEGDDTAEVANGGVRGEEGADVIRAVGESDSYLYSGPGDDRIIGSPGADDIFPADGNDIVLAGAGNDIVHAGRGDDRTRAGAGRDRVYGGAGSDDSDGGPGRDHLDYGHFRLREGEGGLSIDLAAGTVSSPEDSARVRDFERVTGSEGNDEIKGTGVDELIDGFVGNDVIYARGGDDEVRVEDVYRTSGPVTEAKTVFGGEGADTIALILSSGGGIDELSFDGGGGRDLLQVARRFRSGEPLRIDLAAGEITGDGEAAVTGIEDVTDGDGDHTLIGDDRPNDLNGRGGDDTIVGGGGRDTGTGARGTDSCDTEVRITCE